MSKEGWCDDHEARISGVGHFVCDAFILAKALESGKGPVNGCWACALTDREFRDVLVRSATLKADAAAHGGSYTTKTVALSMGRGNGSKP